MFETDHLSQYAILGSNTPFETSEKPTDPTDPTDPTTPTDPTDPAGPTDPTTPTDPADPADPTDPAKPEQQGKPSETRTAGQAFWANRKPPDWGQQQYGAVDQPDDGLLRRRAGNAVLQAEKGGGREIRLRDKTKPAKAPAGGLRAKSTARPGAAGIFFKKGYPFFMLWSSPKHKEL